VGACYAWWITAGSGPLAPGQPRPRIRAAVHTQGMRRSLRPRC
jgi:hypothetical protein